MTIVGKGITRSITKTYNVIHNRIMCGGMLPKAVETLYDAEAVQDRRMAGFRIRTEVKPYQHNNTLQCYSIRY